MASTESDQSSEPVKENGSEANNIDSAADLKAKMNSSNNHSSHNGVSNHNSDGDKFKSPSSSSKHSSSNSSEHKERSKDGKHHSSSSSSSSSKHRDGSSSSSSKHRESSSSSKHRDGSSSSSKPSSSSSSSSSKHKDGSSSSSSSKHRDGSSSSSKHKDGSSSSSSKSKEGGSSSHSKDRSSDHKHSSSSSSDKHRSSSSGDKHRSSSSSSKPSSSSSSDKHSKSKEGSSSSSVKKESSGSSKSSSHKSEDKKPSSSHASPPKVKLEPGSPTKSSSDEAPKKSLSPPKSPVKVIKAEVKMEVKKEPSSDEDEKPLSVRVKETAPAKVVKRPKLESEDDDDEPLSARADKVKKQKVEVKKKAVKRKNVDNGDADIKPAKAAKKGKNQVEVKGVKKEKKEKQEDEVWRWWEEEKRADGVKWTFLEHKGPVFAPEYEKLPSDIKFYYDGKPMKLHQDTEEVVTFYAKMLEHDYVTKEVFNQNFFKDWRKVMNKQEKEILTDLKKCNFTEIHEYFKVKSEERKNWSKEQKNNLKKKNEETTEEYGYCKIDGHKEKIGNFRIEPPGLFRGRGDHPKQGMLKRRVMPEDVIINCSKDSEIPVAPEGHKWKEVRHDNRVTWLSSWTENIQGSVKYVMLNPASKLKGEKDWAKYETARRLHKTVDKIRAVYREEWKSKEMRVRQRSVALYFIDKLALRAGNEKEEGETADTVGCCSLRIEHLKLHEELDGKPFVVDFDFLGKDSIRYTNSLPVEKRVFKNLQLFTENKQPEDDVFDRLNTTLLNKHLQELMEGLTAKVFRTYNASHTLQEQLNLLTNPEDTIPAKILSYNRANRAVAILCNHQRAVPKSFAKSMENLVNKVAAKRKEIKQCKKDIKDVKADYKATKTAKARTMYEKKKKLLTRLEESLVRLEVQATDKDENKEIALGTSKLNYLDPRISIAWCKKYDVPIEKIYNKTQRLKFRWAIDMADAEFQF